MKTLRLFIILLVCFGFSGCVLQEQPKTQEVIIEKPEPKKVAKTKKKKQNTKQTVKIQQEEPVEEPVVSVQPAQNSTEPYKYTIILD